MTMATPPEAALLPKIYWLNARYWPHNGSKRKFSGRSAQADYVDQLIMWI